MTNEELVLDTAEMKSKLQDLQHVMPEADQSICEFGKMLADRLNPSLVPMGFVMAAVLLIEDLKTGTNGFDQQRILSPLVGLPPVFYTLLLSWVPIIADAVAPRDFAEQAKAFYKQAKG